jgi:hypothetical protein
MSASAFWRDDSAENSIMQTITIAVSAILIASGLVTAPGLINNARDNNATNDLANIAYGEEYLMGTNGSYSTAVTKAQADKDGTYLGNQEGIKYTLSNTASAHGALVCNDPQWHYLIKAKSSSGKTFYRSSGKASTSTDITQLEIPSCITKLDGYASFVSGASDPVAEPEPSTPAATTPPVTTPPTTPPVVETPLVFSSAPKYNKLVNRSVNIPLTTNADASKVTYSVTDGTLPTGTALQDDSITGEATKGGTYDFTIKAATPTQSVTQDFTVKVVLTDVDGWSANSPLNSAQHNWDNVSSSTDGVHQIVNDGKNTYVSQDSGISWNPVSVLTGSTYKVGISPDGKYLWAAGNLATTGAISIYRSADSGTTWSSVTAGGSGATGTVVNINVAQSGAMQIESLATNYGLYTYTVNGAGAVLQTVPKSYGTTSFVTGATGNDYAINATNASNSGKVYWKSGSGSSTTTLPAPNLTGFWMGKYGTADVNISAINGDGKVYQSTNGGNTFVLKGTSALRGVTELEVTSSGKLVAIANGKLMLSKDLGATWTDISPNPDATYSAVETTANDGITVTSSVVNGAGGYVFKFTGTL